jgi:uncharacterized membrane protein
VWIGLSAVCISLLIWAGRQEEHVFAAALYRWVSWVELPTLVLGPILLVVTGVALVLDGPWRFGDTWVVIGITGYVVALVLGSALQAPGKKRMNELLLERGPGDPETVATRRRIDALWWPELGIILIVLLAMTTKPVDGGTAGFWATVVVILGVVGVLTARGLRSAAVAEPSPP